MESPQSGKISMYIFLKKQTFLVALCIFLAGCAATLKPILSDPQVPVIGTSAGGDIDTVMSNLGGAACSLGTLKVTLDGIAKSVESQRLLYSRNKMDRRDCSGIYHRVIDAFRTSCPGPAYPPSEKRNTRALAKWYVDQDQMHWIDKPLLQDNLIRVGAVMFFGQRDTHYTSSQLHSDLMFQSRKGINHMGIVTRVKIKNGHVEQYWMLHGHGKEGKTMAGITSTTYKNHAGVMKYNNQNRHYLSIRDGAMPPYGNWDEHWVGVAPVLNPQRLFSLNNQRGQLF